MCTARPYVPRTKWKLCLYDAICLYIYQTKTTTLFLSNDKETMPATRPSMNQRCVNRLDFWLTPQGSLQLAALAFMRCRKSQSDLESQRRGNWKQQETHSGKSLTTSLKLDACFFLRKVGNNSQIGGDWQIIDTKQFMVKISMIKYGVLAFDTWIWRDGQIDIKKKGWISAAIILSNWIGLVIKITIPQTLSNGP